VRPSSLEKEFLKPTYEASIASDYEDGLFDGTKSTPYPAYSMSQFYAIGIRNTKKMENHCRSSAISKEFRHLSVESSMVYRHHIPQQTVYLKCLISHHPQLKSTAAYVEICSLTMSQPEE
jgi:hypothetical protein